MEYTYLNDCAHILDRIEKCLKYDNESKWKLQFTHYIFTCSEPVMYIEFHGQ